MQDAPKIATLTEEELAIVLESQLQPPEHRVFICPMCETIQSAMDFVRAGVEKEKVDNYLAFSCIGRWTHGKPPPDRNGTQEGCNWTLGGLLKCHELEVVTADGKRHPLFKPGDAEQAAKHRARFEQIQPEGKPDGSQPSETSD